jgi:FdrA protein
VNDHVEVRHGEYHDSVTLLQVSSRLGALPGVGVVQVAMATPLNLDVLATAGFDLPATVPDDLVVAVRVDAGADDPDAVVAGVLVALQDALSPREQASGDAAEAAPRTTRSAVRRSGAPLVLVSVPGEHAAAEAWDALDAGASVMLFSDNVGVDDEVALKRAAAERGLLVMGPDCGTAVVGGVGLGFANAVRPGPVSLVAASGTGAQHLMALLDLAGVGVRHCLGVGGRDLSAAVGGLGALSAVGLLADDDATKLVVLVSKPADAEVVSRVASRATDLGLDLVHATLGPGRPDLTQVAEQVLDRLGAAVPSWATWGGAHAPASPGLLRGLFAGGTLCDEAMAIAAPRLGGIASNVPLEAAWPRLDATGPGALAASFAANGHAVVDLGDDSLTVGRPHPMIDPSLRLEALAAAARDERVRVVLLDVVLGHGAHADPAAVHAPVVSDALGAARAAGRDLDVVVSLVGTRDDPQGLDRQAEALAAAGAFVHASNAAATRAALDLLGAT